MKVLKFIVMIVVSLSLCLGCASEKKTDYQATAAQLAAQVRQGTDLRVGSVYEVTGKLHQVRKDSLVLEGDELTWINFTTEGDTSKYHKGEQIVLKGKYLRHERLETCGALGHDLYFSLVK